jgi:hypothetical protein
MLTIGQHGLVLLQIDTLAVRGGVGLSPAKVTGNGKRSDQPWAVVACDPTWVSRGP